MSASEADSNSLVNRLLSSSGSIHAVLFYGPDGTDTDRLAKELAIGWLCKNTSEGAACGQCSICSAFANGRLIDFMPYDPWGPQNLIKLAAMRPEKKKKPDDDAPVPCLIDFFRTPPMMAARKVAFFRQAHRMNNDAANALLKTLEEPPHYAKVILATTEFSRILPTVRSRCMAVACAYNDLHDDDPLLKAWGSSPGMAETVLKHQEQYQSLWTLLDTSIGAPPGAAIALAERARELSEAFAKAQGTSTRVAQAEVLRCLAAWLLARRPERPDLVQLTVEAHRLVSGNINAGALFDHVWAEIMAA